MSKQINVTVPDATHSQLKELADQKGMTMSAFVRHCIQVYIMAMKNKEKKQKS